MCLFVTYSIYSAWAPSILWICKLIYFISLGKLQPLLDCYFYHSFSSASSEAQMTCVFNVFTLSQMSSTCFMYLPSFLLSMSSLHIFWWFLVQFTYSFCSLQVNSFIQFLISILYHFVFTSMVSAWIFSYRVWFSVNSFILSFIFLK